MGHSLVELDAVARAVAAHRQTCAGKLHGKDSQRQTSALNRIATPSLWSGLIARQPRGLRIPSKVSTLAALTPRVRSELLVLGLIAVVGSALADQTPSHTANADRDQEKGSPSDRALECDKVSLRTGWAIQALVDYGQPGTADPFSNSPDPAATVEPVWRRLAQLLAAPDLGLDSLCSVLPVDRVDPQKRETLLTAAIKSGQVAFVTAALKIVSTAKGNVYAKNGSGEEPIYLAKDRFPHDKEVLSALDPIPVTLLAVEPYGKSVGPWERLQTAGALGTVAPDVDDSSSRIPAYVATLLSSQQGVSIGAANQNGAASPKIQGELRFTLARTPADPEFIGRFFAYTNGNVNTNKDPDKPTNPDWAGIGLGYKDLWTGRPDNSVVTSDHWFEARTKAGEVENLLAHHHARYAVSNTEASFFADPFPRTLNDSSSDGHHSGAATYLAFTVGAQFQKRSAGVPIPDERSVYSFERIDLYSYPLWIANGLRPVGDNNTSCFPEIVSVINGECSTVILHVDRQVVNNRLGALNEYSLSWGFRKGLALVFTRSVGVQDPLSAFGVKLPKSAQSQISLKITPSTGGGN